MVNLLMGEMITSYGHCTLKYTWTFLSPVAEEKMFAKVRTVTIRQILQFPGPQFLESGRIRRENISVCPVSQKMPLLPSPRVITGLN